MFRFVYKNIDIAHKLDKASEPMENYQKHMHYFDEILYFVKGDVIYTVEAESRKLEPGDIVYAPSGKYHFATVNSDVSYERYVFKFPEQFVPEYIKQKRENFSPFLGNIKRFSDVFKAFDDYPKYYGDDELYAIFMCDLIGLLVKIFRNPTPIKDQTPDVISKIINYIDENLDKRITLDTLNEAFNFSKSYISNEFKTHMKIPIMQYIRTKKILAAHKLIISGTKKAVVAEMFGFEDYSTFYRSYVKIMGFAPTDGSKSTH
ncbi:MAG: helix-turn-helix transcriptional regulator [Clostridiales bacterium]|nr:helix-turn-helix transcriptional regulator [Clostridiales bacterium]